MRLRALLLALLLASIPGVALGAPAAPTKAEREHALDEADALTQEVLAHFMAREIDAALPKAERVLALVERGLGDDQPDIVPSLGILGLLHEAKGELAEAQRYYLRALALLDKQKEPDPRGLDQALEALGSFNDSAGNDAVALGYYRRLYEQRRKQHGDHPRTAWAGLRVARVLVRLERRDEARALGDALRAYLVPQSDAAGGALIPALVALADFHSTAGESAQAKQALERALALGKRGDDPTWLAKLTGELAVVHHDLGEHAQARQRYEEALALRRKDQPSGESIATLLDQLAALHEERGELERALGLYREARTFREQHQGPRHPDMAYSLAGGGQVLRKLGDLGEARRWLSLALAIREERLPDPHLDTATTHNQLALVLQDLADLDGAEQHYQRSLDMRRALLAADHAEIAVALSNLAVIAHLRDEEDRALALFGEAQAIREKRFGPDSLAVALTRSEMGGVYVAKRDYEAAETHYRAALRVFEQRLSRSAPRTTWLRLRLGYLHELRGEVDRAPEAYRAALDAYLESRDRDPTLEAVAAGDVALALWTRGEPEAALEPWAQACRATETQLGRVLLYGSEREKLTYFDTTAHHLSFGVSFHLRGAPDSARAAELALEITLQRKGRVLDATARAGGGHGGAQANELGALADARAKLSRAVVSGPRPGQSREQHEQAIRTLEALAEQLQRQVDDASAEERRSGRAVTLAAVRAVLPRDAALVELVRWSPYDPKLLPGPERWHEPARYAAYVLHDGTVRGVDLGDAASLEQTVERLRHALAHPAREFRAAARAAGERMLDPLVPLLGDARHLLLSPDGALHLVPFGAVLDGEGHHAIERYRVSYLTTGRDLLRAPAPDARAAPLIVGAPDFGPIDAPGESPRGGELARVRFPPLPGTIAESRALERLLGAELKTGARASETALRAIHGPRILHVATHGFFFADVAEPPPDASRGVTLVGLDDAAAPARAPVNPLLRSGLALAGANLGAAGDDDGVLTALEAASLDLAGTKLVVLSACETGVGEVHNGQGVYGLRRALTLAGAETLVTSLWKVEDGATRDLMIAYYGGLEAGGGRSESLRRAQLGLLADPARAHPFYWASFIPIGDWRALDGRDEPPQDLAAVRVAPPGCACGIAAPPSESFAAPRLLAASALISVARSRRRRPVTVTAR